MVSSKPKLLDKPELGHKTGSQATNLGKPGHGPRHELGTEPLTYGVELEFVFTFHESLLKGAKVKKDIPYIVRGSSHFNWAWSFKGRYYNSWGVHVDNGMDYRPYEAEPLEIAQDIIQRATNIQFDLLVDPRDGQKKNNDLYKNWHVATEWSVRGVGSDRLVTNLGDRVTEENKNDWDSYGLEAVTRVMTTGIEADLNEIRRVTDALLGNAGDGTSTSQHGAFVTNQAGLHVHVQAPKSLDVLKELVFILIIYEDEITRMHPPCRRPGHVCTEMNLYSNRVDLLREIQEKRGEGGEGEGEGKDGDEGVGGEEDEGEDEDIDEDIVKPEELPKLVTVDHIREAVNSCQDEDALKSIIGKSKDKIVSWAYLNRGEGFPRTIEFRQHRGTLDFEDIRWWVFFVTGLVRLADLYARRKGCRVKSWDQRISVFDLMVDMNMPQAGIDFYLARIAGYTHYPVDGPLNAPDYVLKPTAESLPGVAESKDGANTGASPGGSNPSQGGAPGEETSSNKRGPVGGLIQEDCPGKIPKVSGMCTEAEYEGGIVIAAGQIADEEMILDGGAYAYVNLYNPSEWELVTTESAGPAQRGKMSPKGMCGIWAILHSLKAQYPDHEGVRSLNFKTVHDAVNNPAKPFPDTPIYLDKYSDEQLAAGLETLGNYRLVRCLEQGGKQRAMRIAKNVWDSGQNVYVHWQRDYLGAFEHWSGMRRKPAAK